MAQKTGRKVSGAAQLPATGKKAVEMNKMQPGVPEGHKMGAGDMSDHSDANDGSKGAKSAPKGAHKGPDRTK
jgi:hypothetical protein